MTEPVGEPHTMRVVCNEQNSVLESDLELAARLKLVVSLRIHETEMGYYVTAIFGLPANKRKGFDDAFSKHPQMSNLVRVIGKIWFLTSRRHRTAPRVHKSLGRLNELMREKYPTDEIVLLRRQYLPGEPLIRGRRKRQQDQSNTC